MNNEKLSKANELSKEIDILKKQLLIAQNGEKIRTSIDVYVKSSDRYESLFSEFVDFEVIKAIAVQRISKELKSKTEEFENL